MFPSSSSFILLLSSLIITSLHSMRDDARLSFLHIPEPRHSPDSVLLADIFRTQTNSFFNHFHLLFHPPSVQHLCAPTATSSQQLFCSKRHGRGPRIITNHPQNAPASLRSCTCPGRFASCFTVENPLTSHHAYPNAVFRCNVRYPWPSTADALAAVISMYCNDHPVSLPSPLLPFSFFLSRSSRLLPKVHFPSRVHSRKNPRSPGKSPG